MFPSTVLRRVSRLSHARVSEVAGAGLVVLLSAISVVMAYWGKTLLGHPDGTAIFAPFAYNVSRLVSIEGILGATYDPFILAGYSHWQNANYHPLYPLFFNWLGSDTQLEDTFARLEYVIRLHLVIYSLGIYILTRQLGASASSALVMAVVAPWMPAVLSTTGWPHILASLSWLPWVIALNVRIRQLEYFSWRLAVGLALVSLLLIYAQPAQNLILALLACSVYWVLSAAYFWQERRTGKWRSLNAQVATLAVAAILISGLALPYLWSLLHFHADSIRWLGSHGAIVGNDRLPLAALREHGYQLSELLAVIRRSHEYTKDVGNMYLGVPILGLLLLGVRVRRNIDHAALAVLVLCSVVLSLQSATALTQHLPGVNKVRQIAWWTCLAVTTALPLAAVSLDFIRDSTPRPRAYVLIVVLLSALAGLIFQEYLIVGVAASAFVLLVLTPEDGRISWAAIVGLVLASVVPTSSFAPRDTRAAFENQQWQELVDVARRAAASFSPRERLLYRFAVDPEVRDYQLLTQLLATHGLRMIRGNIHPQDYDKFRLLYFPNDSIAATFGVRYVLRKDAARGWIWVVHFKALPRAYFVSGDRLTQKQSPVEFWLANPGFAAGSVVSNELPYGVVARAVTFAELQELGPSSASGRFRADEAGVFVWNEPIEGGWDVLLNGEPVQQVRVNGYQTGVLVPKPGFYHFQISRRRL